MRVVSIDIETTGLEPDTHSIIQVGACIVDLMSPFDRKACPQILINVWQEDAVWSAWGVRMNHEIMTAMINSRLGLNGSKMIPLNEVKLPAGEMLLAPDEVAGEFRYWLSSHDIPTNKGITVTGKNFSAFDLQFLNRLPNWSNNVYTNYRAIDVGSHFWMPGDPKLPNLQECVDRAGLKYVISHTALDDALVVGELTHMIMSKK